MENKSTDLDQKTLMFLSKSCRGVSFEMNVSVERVLEKRKSAIVVISEHEEPTILSWFSGNLSKLTRSARLISIGSLNRRFTESVSKASKTASFDYNFGQIPPDDEGLFGDPETGSWDVACTTTLEGTAAQEKLEKKRTPTPDLGAILLELCQLTIYKYLLLLCIALNVLGGILAAANLFPYAKANPSLFAIGNVLMLVLVRNEVLLRVLFWIIVKILGYPFIPLGFKYAVTSFMLNLGGIHSGCGVSALIWVMYALTRIFGPLHSTPREIFAVTWGICLMLLLSCIGAFPLFRMLHHNVFERVHRFAGWTSLALVWIFIILSYSTYDPSNHKYLVSVRSLLKRQVVWFTIVITFLIILPWLFLRKVPVEAVVTDSKNVTLLNLSGGIKPGILIRISPSPLSEWHAFGIISDGRKRHTIIAGAVGDFTKSLVENPPEYLWVRTFYFTGIPFLVNLYNRVLLVATGSGAGVYLSFIMQPTKPDVHLIWIANSIQKTYGDDIYKLVSETASEKITVFDTATLGSRSMMKEMVIKKAKEWEAQVVFVTSNRRGTSEFVTSCRDAGIAAFGPIWDS
ncbi:hypothetical protein O6H91_01G131700 [Diphasiastrum complanatum]|uniref:Uncharacterized protein n=1 Tax=Diphasiastrum complanatum TaxID=34168 RepID=A0ACC2EW10_DIPCM|nr:hypothetical protein O6H91_01G131700 [Diphasiastrum complanatum]